MEATTYKSKKQVSRVPLTIVEERATSRHEDSGAAIVSAPGHEAGSFKLPAFVFPKCPGESPGDKCHSPRQELSDRQELRDRQELLRRLSRHIRQSERQCDGRWHWRLCLCHRLVVPGHTPMVRSGCMHRDCTRCAPYVGKRRARRVRHRLETGRLGGVGHGFRPRPVLYTVLTVPPELRERFVDPHEWSKVRRRVWELLVQSYGADFGVECSHPVGDDPSLFHPHCNFLWVQRQDVQPKGYLDVDSLRAAWSKILACDVTDIHHEYIWEGYKIWHRCKYVTRVFPGFSGWLGSMRWFGHYPRGCVPEKKRRCCSRCGYRFEYTDLTDIEVRLYVPVTLQDTS